MQNKSPVREIVEVSDPSSNNQTRGASSGEFLPGPNEREEQGRFKSRPMGKGLVETRKRKFGDFQKDIGFHLVLF